jgi:preprotein translocase subunit YajC
MQFTGFLATTIPVVVIGVITFFIIAIVQEGKGDQRGNAIRHAFLSIISLVMLSMVVVSAIYLGQLALKQWVFTNAPDYSSYSVSSPPAPEAYLVGVKSLAVPAGSTGFTCSDTCEFSDTDKTSIRQWLTDYDNWRKGDNTGISVARQRDAVTALSFLLIAAPLFFFFFRMLQQEAKKEREMGKHKPGALRSVYFYLIAFSGLVAAVISSALLVNLGLKTAFGLGGEQNQIPYPQPAVNSTYVTSIVNCAAACGFTVQEVQLAQDWQTDNQDIQKRYNQQGTSKAQGDLAGNIPIVLVTLPLFWYHFATIRRESQDVTPEPTKPTTV